MNRRRLVRQLRAKGSRLRLTARYPSEARLYRKYRDLTMAQMYRFVETIRLCKTASAVAGDIVECGVWRGGMSAAIAEAVAPEAIRRGGLPKRSILFDSFEGLPPATSRDGASALAFQADVSSRRYRDNCRAAEGEARAAMSLAGVADYRIVKGWFEETVPDYAGHDPDISILRLDGDWYDSIATCLEHLFPKVVVGGVVLIDDYGRWEGCTRAVHDYLSKTHAAEPIRRSRTGMAYLIRR